MNHPGDLQAAEVHKPEPNVGEALVRVHRIGVCGTDLHAFAGKQPFFDYPRVLGHELGVEVIDAPDNDRGITAGVRCCVEPALHCGDCIACRRGRVNCCANLRVMGVHIDGGMRPLLNVPIDKLHPSASLSYDQLALIEPMAIGAHAVARGQPEPDESVLVIGAGPIGIGVMQSAKARQARVIAMDLDARRLEFCQETLGIAATIVATQSDPAEHLRQLNQGDLPTLVIDATGHPGSMMRCFDLAAPGGRIVYVGLFPGDVTFHDPDFHRKELTLLASRNATSEIFTNLIGQVEQGCIDTSPWITHRLTLSEVPGRFESIAGSEGLIKAMIEVHPKC